MEVRRRKVVGQGSSCASLPRRHRRGEVIDDSEIVTVRPDETHSQWTMTRRATDEGETLRQAVSSALTSLGESPLVTFIIDLVKQAINLLWWPTADTTTGVTLDDHTRHTSSSDVPITTIIGTSRSFTT